ncbi:MAG: S1C family serine protease [Nanoarchaeota archaeon]
MKRTLESLVVALAFSSTGCAATAMSNSALSTPISGQTADGKYDSVDNYVNVADIQALRDSNYMIISESKYKGPDGKEVTLQSFGTGVVYQDVGNKTYLVTAYHVMANEKEVYDFFGRKYELLSEKFYLLDDDQVERFQSLLRKSSESEEGKFYLKNGAGIKREAKNIILASKELGALLNVIKPREVKTMAYNSGKDLAIVSVPKLDHKPLAYTIGDSRELQTQNIVYVVGWPLGLVKNVTQGHITSVNDSPLANSQPETNFIFDASISGGNSGGAVFAVRDGKFELIGITDATYLGANDLYVGVKINPVKEIFKENSIRCSSGWKCNLSQPYELKL